MAEYRLRAKVNDELLEIWAFIARDNPDAATRVVEAAYETFQALADNPRMGRVRKFRRSRLKNLRSWRVAGFDHYMILYRSIPDGIEVFHVLHGARDLERFWKDEN